MPLGQMTGYKSDSSYCGVEKDFDDDVPCLLSELSGGIDFLLSPP